MRSLRSTAAPTRPSLREEERTPGGCHRAPHRPLLTCFATNLLSSTPLFSFLRATSCSGSARRNRRSAAILLLLLAPRRGRAAGGARGAQHVRRAADAIPPTSALPPSREARPPLRPAPRPAGLQLPACAAPPPPLPPRAPSGKGARLSRWLRALESRACGVAFAGPLACPALCSPESHLPLPPHDSPACEPFKSGSGRRPRAGGDGRGSGWPRLGLQERYAPGGSRSRRPSAAVGQ